SAGDAATLGVGAMFLGQIRVPRAPRAERASFLGELRAGWQEVTSRQWVWTSIAYFSIWNVALGPLFVLGPFVAERSLGGASSWGSIVTCSSVGSLVGASAARHFTPRRPLTTGLMLFGLVALEPALLARPSPASV